MPKFKHGDKVLILPEASIPHAGETGVIWGAPNRLFSMPPVRVAEGQGIPSEGEQVEYIYQVVLDGSDETAAVRESVLMGG